MLKKEQSGRKRTTTTKKEDGRTSKRVTKGGKGNFSAGKTNETEDSRGSASKGKRVIKSAPKQSSAGRKPSLKISATTSSKKSVRENSNSSKTEVKEKRVIKDTQKPLKFNSETKSTGRSSGTSRDHKVYRTKSSQPTRKPRNPIARADDGSVRLNKHLAATGLCSRREADELIKQGLITVNDQVITELGIKINPTDIIKYNGSKLRQEKPMYLLLNKPKDYVTTTRDPNAKRTVMELVRGACKERIVPVGRLDRNTTGVLLLTNDGDLAKELTHPSSNKMKIYQVSLDKNLQKTDFLSIMDGIELEDGFIKADDLQYIDPNDKSLVGIEIHSGRNRIVRRIFEHFGYNVSKLDRVYFAGLTKKGLQRGQWRFLTDKEVAMLKMGSYK